MAAGGFPPPDRGRARQMVFPLPLLAALRRARIDAPFPKALRFRGRGCLGLRTAALYALVAAILGAAGPAQAAAGDESVIDSICGIDRFLRPRAVAPRRVSHPADLAGEQFPQANAVSPAGARGIAQFMPAHGGRARPCRSRSTRNRQSPRRPPCLAELRNQLGNLGLAAAAYNAGPGRVARYVAEQGRSARPKRRITSPSSPATRPRNGGAKDAAKLTDEAVFPDSLLHAGGGEVPPRRTDLVFAHSSFWAPWGVQISGSFNKSRGAAPVPAGERRLYRHSGRGAAHGAGRPAPQPGLPPVLPRPRPGAVAPAGRGAMRQTATDRRRLRRAPQQLSRPRHASSGPLGQKVGVERLRPLGEWIDETAPEVGVAAPKTPRCRAKCAAPPSKRP